MDPCAEDPAGRPEDHVFHGWDVPVFSEQDYLDLYTPVSDLIAADQKKEQVNVNMKNEEAAVRKTPVQHLREPQDSWNIDLIDSARGSNSRTALLCKSTSLILSEHSVTHDESSRSVSWGRDESSRSVFWARVDPVLVSDDLLFRVSVPWRSVELPIRWRLNSTARELMEAVLETLDHQAGVSGQYLMKLCDSEEFLRSDEILGSHEQIQVHHKFASDVPVRMMLWDSIDKTLARDEEDDRQAFHFNPVLESASASSTIRSCLQEKLNIYSKAVNELMRSQCGVCAVVDSVGGVCEQMCGVTTADLEEAVGRLERFAPLAQSPVETSDCETAVVELHQALLKLLHIFFTNFDLDFRGPDVPDPPASDVRLNTHMLQLDLSGFYRLLPDWVHGYDHFSVRCSLTHCGRSLTEPVVCENISTSLTLHCRIRCSRLLVFPVPVGELPYESMLTFHLLGSKQSRNPELLCWAALALFSNRTLVHGTVLLSMSTQVPPRCPPSSALTHGHRQPTGVILQLVFPDSEQWRYERASARPGSVLESPSCEPVCDELHKRIADVSQKHCLSLLTENEKVFLWSRRQACSSRNSLLHLVLGSAPTWRPQDQPEIYGILRRWRISCEEALFLLSHEFHDQFVRSVAVQHFQQMCDSQLEEFLPQLVQALKTEWDSDGPLVTLLLSRSLRCIRIAQQLYWLLVDALEDWLYKSWISTVLSALKHCCGRALRLELQRETQLMDLLTHLAQRIHTADKHKRKDVFRRERWKIGSFFSDGLSCRLPLDPAVEVTGVNIEAFKVYNSNAAPVEVSFITADPLGRNYSVICKSGENLRQDMLVLQIVRLVDRMWRLEQLDMCMVTYRCLSAGRDRGLVEVVQDAVTLATIHQEWGLSGALREDTLEKWFHVRNKTKDDYEKAVLNFLHSCAGWCVVTFVLGICDRHNDNIMIKHSGHMFHIDFGKIMGNAQKFGSIRRDRTPFIFTPEMQRFITGGGENPQRFHRFVELCCNAYNSLRTHTPLLLSLLQSMLAAGMPDVKDVRDLQYVHNNLRPHDSELEATSYFTRKIKESMESFPVKLNFLIHNMVQFSSGRRPEPLTDSRISNRANIQQAVIQKYSGSGKDVTYELKLTIEDGFVISHKSFAQLETLHKLLQKHFIESTLPKFPHWFHMSFTASRRMVLLNRYLKELFSGPCRGNEYVCSLFLDGPDTTGKSEADAHLRPQIQLYLSYKDFKLSVMIKHLKNIRLSNGSCPDAYVVTRLRPDPHDQSKRKTKAVRSNDNPTFNELIEYRNVLKLHGRVLEVTVKSRKAFVAATNVVLGERVLDQEKWFPLGFSAV
ncbi:phosphatidylinositol 4-phosphate 3-kinase C2 domain-containing subunit gamma isoform X1 [Pimephales promelas]|uniref:phosphatidylinositol 4-phosphate 3-kinase C2 domain-containing subunit gamma isoform X1 n=1 Tax=Pimephales promelas TaxID=90988 RepID=UPI001955F039|nr:phosphatidylinositol 4-phosphate 3-kinase C2 domain-containing subunit gamma isoform X1 [Pimephales promelas]KAG1938615.1 phosphatidylinositol 4-phosphate 3-kinase C2 domain-containing subunit gamma [Pimephales promelas]